MKKSIFLLLFLMIILSGCGKDPAVRSVENYLNNSRKSAFVDTAIVFTDSAMKEVNLAKTLKFYSTDTLYLIPAGNNQDKSCLFIESGGTSPFGKEWNYIYIGVTFDGKGYSYYFIGEDSKEYGITFVDKKTLLDDGMDLIYNGTLEKKSGYDILKTKYNKKIGNTNYVLNGENSSDFSILSKILDTNTSYNKIVIIGSSECSYNKG